MEDFKKRMLAESLQLAQRIENLGEFMETEKYAELEPVELVLLSNQLMYMRGYYHNLNTRIDLIVSEEEMEEFKALCDEHHKDQSCSADV